jgi:hypothetical protein
MNIPEESFQSYLRCEVESAGKRFEQAVENVFALTGGQAGPELVGAARELSENLRLYSGALRRMACFAAHESRAEHGVHA